MAKRRPSAPSGSRSLLVMAALGAWLGGCEGGSGGKVDPATGGGGSKSVPSGGGGEGASTAGGQSSGGGTSSGGAGAGAAGASSGTVGAGTVGGSSGGAGASSGASGSGGSPLGDGGAAGSGSGGGSGCARPAGMPAVTLTYDDALPTQLTTVAPALAAHGLKATFFITDVRSNQTPWAALRSDGHELASHTFKHPCPKSNTWVAPGNANEDYDAARMTTELDESIAMLAALGQPPPYTFAYPCGITWIGEAQESYIPLIEARFAAARGVASGLVGPGVDLSNVPATFSTGDAAALIAIADGAKASGAWVVFGFHGVGGDSNAIAAEPHEALLAYLDENRSQFYVATFGELSACFQP